MVPRARGMRLLLLAVLWLESVHAFTPRPPLRPPHLGALRHDDAAVFLKDPGLPTPSVTVRTSDRGAAALRTGPQGARTRRRLPAEVDPMRRMAAHCIFGAVDLEEAVALVSERCSHEFGALGERIAVVSYADAVHVRFSGGGFSGAKDAFVFPYGAVCCWGFSEAEELRLLRLLEPCTEPSGGGAAGAAPYEPSEDQGYYNRLTDSEFMLFAPGGAPASS